MLPSQIAEFKGYKDVDLFVTEKLNMQFHDVRSMMKLPLPEAKITAGCNFAAVAMMCNLISGISVVLYTPHPPKEGSGKRFKKLLEDFYPWDTDENRREAIRVVYNFTRNSLAHSLGVLKRGSLPIMIEKDPLTDRKLEEIETSTVRPSWVPRAVTCKAEEYILSVWGLYWGVFHMLRRLALDEKQMKAADKRILERKIL